MDRKFLSRGIQGVVAVLLVCANLSCSVNVLETFADKDSEESKLIEAQHLIDKQNYDAALAILLALPSAVQAEREVRSLIASAYAGRAGLNFLDLIQTFDNASSTVLFPLMMQAFPAGTGARISDAGLAEAQLSLVSTDATLRTQDENVLMALVNFAKIGNILTEYADSNDDGTKDPTFEACADADAPGTNMPDSAVREFGLSLVYALNSLAALSNNFASGVLGPLSDCITIESLDDALSPLPEPLNGICSITNPADFTALHLIGFRSLIKESSAIGIGAQCTGDISTCECIP